VPVKDLLGLDARCSDDKDYLLLRETLLDLRKIMIKKNISKSELARRLGVSRQAVYEKFTGKNTTLEWIQKVSASLGVRVKISFYNI